jgi:predicted Fe-Mo cluster-binding NifX family protein
MPVKKDAAATSDLPPLAAPARRALASAGITSLASLSRRREADVMALHGMGPNAMTSLKSALKEKGLVFAKR